MKTINRKPKGFTLVVTILSLLIISILTLGIISVTTANFKMVKVDSRSQSAYYIAESGINKVIFEINEKTDELSEEILSNEDFFVLLDEFLDKDLELLITGFQKNFGHEPISKITIMDKKIIKEEIIGNEVEKVVSYKINSIGEIGKSKREVTTSIEVVHRIEKKIDTTKNKAFDYVLYNASNNMSNYPGGAVIDGSIYGDNIKLESTNTLINGSIISKNSVEVISSVEVNGSIYAINGKVKLSNSNIVMKGDVHAYDDVTLSHGTTLIGNIYTNGGVDLKSSNVKVVGDIHSTKTVTLGSSSNAKNIYTDGDVKFISNGAIIDGDIHAEKNILFGPGASVKNIFTSGNIEFSSNNTINGNVNAVGYVGSKDKGNDISINGNINSSNNLLTRSNNRYKINGNVNVGGSIENGVGNYISGDAIYKINMINLGKINGENIKKDNPIKPKKNIGPQAPNFDSYENIGNKVPLHTYDIGDTNIKSNKNSTIHSILPGKYKDFNLKWNDTIEFTSGNYYFNSISASNSAIKLYLDVTEGPINIYAKNSIEFGSGFKLYICKDGVNFIELNNNLIETNRDLAIELASKVYWETYDDFIMAENCYFLGTILANNNFTTNSGVTLVGAYAVNNGNISMGYAPEVIYSSPDNSDAGNDENGNDGGNPDNSKSKGKNIIPSGSRLIIENPIKEI